MNPALVSIQRCTTYEPDAVRRSVEKAFENVGGIASRIRSTDNVLLKPNLLFGQPPERAVTTHPAVVEAVAALVSDCGAKIFLGDSPPLHSALRNAHRCGLEPVIRKYGITVQEFRHPVSEGWHTQYFTAGIQTPPLARELLEMDFIINLPKLKSHQQMWITCAVKNLFGCVIARRKAFWHFKLRASVDAFAAMLLAILEKTAPNLTLVDAVVSMEGMGPGKGTPTPTGMILAGQDAVAVDRVVAELLAGGMERHFVLHAARRLGFPGADLQAIQTVGLPLTTALVPSFQWPELTPIGFSVPHLVKGLMKYIYQRLVRHSPHSN